MNIMNKTSVQKSLKVILAILLLWLMGLGLFVYKFTSYTSINATQKLDAVIVLTGGQKRIEQGLLIVESDKADQLYISGVNSVVSVDEILSVQDERFSSLECCIEIGVEASDTVGNALEIRSWIRNKRYKAIYLVTSHYHMPRAILEVSMANPDLKIYPQVVISDEFQFNRMDILKLVFFEYNKYLVTFVKSWLA